MASTRPLRETLRLTRLGIRTKFSILFYLVTLISLSVIGWYGYSNASQAYRERGAALAGDQVKEVGRKIEQFLSQVPDDLHFLSEYYAMERYLYWQDLGHQRKRDYWQTVTRDTFRDFLASRDYYYKARYLDAEGVERIKARADRNTGEVRFEAGTDLLEQRNKGYFSRAFALQRGEIYVSPLGLNNEHGRIEKPYTPVLRYAQPVIGANDVHYGVVVINVFADAFLKFIRDAMEGSEVRGFYLIDRNGEYLFHPNPDHTFGHLLGHAVNFNTEFPALAPRIEHDSTETLFESGLIVSHRRIYPNPADHSQYWTLVGMVDEATALSNLRSFEYVFAILVAAVLVLVLVASRYYVGNLVRPLLFVTRQLERLSRGEVVRETITYLPQDEIRRMLDSTDRLLVNVESQAARADAIAEGDFAGGVELLSENDRLGNALNNMTRMLRENRERTERENWLKDGIGQLNRALSGELGPRELADRAIGVLGRYLEAGRGVCYVYLPEEERLDLLGSYMYTERDTLGNHFRLGEGAVGQVALERHPIALNDIRRDAPPVTTGTLSTPPLCTYTFPLLRDEELLGVMELAAFATFDEEARTLLEAAAEAVAAFLYAALQRERIQGLLTTAEEATREAQERSTKLREANARMEQQQQRLQQQTEELQQANAQMEEQQQQLQQQTEELQQANAQMEEQQQQLKQQANELETRNRDLMRSRGELDQRARELELASKYKSEFLANMSHELRTPLNSIILLSKMLAMNDSNHLDEEEAKRAQVIHHAGEELLRLINDILDLSKIEAGKMELHPLPIASTDLMRELNDLFGDAARDKGLDFQVEDTLRGEFVSDRDKVAQVVRNLLSNAFKFTKEGSVTVRVERSDHPQLPIRIAVRDTGIGIPEEKQRAIFDAFQQVDGSISRQYGGTGLGLSISLRFAQLLGGTIELKSRPGEGSEFAILLPLTSPDRGDGEERGTAGLAPPRREAPRAPLATGAPGTGGGEVHDDRANLKSSDPVVLVIDDEPAFGEAVAAMNRKLGYKTLVALSGEEGLRMAKTYRPRGILLDLGLPDRDGTEVLRELKATRELRRIPVYIVSARDKDAGLLKSGIVGYLTKPVDDRQLAEAEAEILARVGEEGRSILVVEGDALRADQVAELIRVDGVRVEGTRDGDSALARVGEGGCDLVIVDLERRTDTICRDFCPALRERYPDVPLMLFGGHELSGEEEARLRAFTDSIIVKTPHAEERMLDNIERFLKGMPDEGEAPTAMEAGRHLDGRRILVVDDDPRNLFVITSALESQGATVLNALNGRKALEQLKSEAVDLIFMDIMMPEMDGYEAIRAIKADPRLKPLPVVALTAKALKDDRDKALSAGADDYLAKPVDFEVLINMARVWCEERG
ncbi:response regulator [Endothiovibrio diazotrophicus]